MVIGFVNAGIMSLMQAATIIFGANIGTTITGQIVALEVRYIPWSSVISPVNTIVMAREVITEEL